MRQSSQASNLFGRCVRGGDRVASRVRVAASACLVASGLLIGGAGGAMALADPGHGHGNSDDRHANDSMGDAIVSAARPGQRQRPESVRARAAAAQPVGYRPTGRGCRRGEAATRQGRPEANPEAEPRQGTSETSPTSRNGRDHGRGPTRVNRRPSARLRRAAAVVAAPCPLPRFSRRSPQMQLPGELAAGCARRRRCARRRCGRGGCRAPVGPAAPIALPVIVAPPIGLGAGAGGAGPAGYPAGPPPGAPARRQRRAACRTCPAACQRGQQCRGTCCVLPDRIHRISANRRTAAGRGVGCAGLAGILVLTGAGGLVGYRQAKAGHAVRAGGTARFMR